MFNLRNFSGARFIVFSALAASFATADVASAQFTPSKRGAASTPPAQNATAWGQDNCLYQFIGSTWRSLDQCRVLRSATVYDIYKPSTRNFTLRVDESERGWLGALLFTDPSKTWFKFATDGTGRILAFVNNSWQDVTASVTGQQRGSQVPQPNAGRTPAPAPSQSTSDANMAQIMSLMNAHNQNMSSIIMMKPCESSYRGC